MEEIVYGVYHGCIYEGGGTGRTLYREEKDAIAQALECFELEIKNTEEMAPLNKTDENYEMMKRHQEQYSWRKCDRVENRWHNTVDEIQVIEYVIH